MHPDPCTNRTGASRPDRREASMPQPGGRETYAWEVTVTTTALVGTLIAFLMLTGAAPTPLPLLWALTATAADRGGVRLRYLRIRAL